VNRLRSAEVLEGPLPAHFCKSLRKLCCGRHGSGRFRNDAILALAPLATVAPVPDHTGEQSRVVADPTLDTVAIGALQPLSASDHKDPMAIITLTVRSGAASMAVPDVIGRTLKILATGASTAASVTLDASPGLTDATGMSLSPYLLPRSGTGIMWQLAPAKLAQVIPCSEGVMKATLCCGEDRDKTYRA
jgi:hypothetical protein